MRDIDVPPELIQAARSGRLVFFIGAGASRDDPSGLPDFRNLVSEIGRNTAYPPTERDLEFPDKYLGRLASRGVDVHRLVHASISREGSSPNRLHRAIVRLAKANPSSRIVTTNYDRHLTTAANDCGFELANYEAPALPVGDDFEGLVYLHGSLAQETRRLVVTDQDFGHAYLREAWAGRFLERMFSAFTVAFIGYSHSDVVVQYFSRALVNSGRRFIFTQQPESDEWHLLGLTPINYPVRDDPHGALPEALERWAARAEMGQMEHRRVIKEMVASEPPAVPDEASYLEDSVSDPIRIRYFCEAARGSAWLKWVAAQEVFEQLFVTGDTGNSVDPDVLVALTEWVVVHHVMNGETTAAAFRLLCDRKWTMATWERITFRLFTPNNLPNGWFEQWLSLALSQAPAVRSDWLDGSLAEHDWTGSYDMALLLFEDRTRPIPSSTSIGWTAALDVDLPGDEYWLTVAWNKVFKPCLPQHPGTLDLFAHQLQVAYRLMHTLNPNSSFDTLSLHRSAIEPHPQDNMRRAFDVLIDATRDCIESLLMQDPAQADAVIDKWSRSPDALFRRLAVHAWAVRDDRGASEKLAWLIEGGRLFDDRSRHEVFSTLWNAARDANAATIKLVLAAIRKEAAGSADPHTLHRALTLIEWLHRADPESELLAKAFDEAQRENPEFEVREHPDLNYSWGVGDTESLQPFTSGELHDKICKSPQSALVAIRTALGVGADPMPPVHVDALTPLRGCVSQYPEDGLRIGADLIEDEVDDRLRRSIIAGWSEAQLQDNLAEQVVDAIRTWDVTVIRSEAITMLINGGQEGHPTTWYGRSNARRLAAELWPDRPIPTPASTSPLNQAINHPAGRLAQFWTSVVQHEWNANREDWTGLTTDLMEQLSVLVDDGSINGDMARTVLGANLHFFFAADREWTTAQLLPLFDWADHPNDAPYLWGGFLVWGRFTEEMLESGLLDFYLQTCKHRKALVGDDLRRQLTKHLADMALFTTSSPMTWLAEFVVASDESSRIDWSRAIARRLREMSPDEQATQWLRWIKEYWTSRAKSLPLPLTLEESSSMAEWVLVLPSHRAEAVALLAMSPAPLPMQGNFLRHLCEVDLTQDSDVWETFLTHLLRSTSHQKANPQWHAAELRTIVEKLRRAQDGAYMKDLIEAAMQAGFADAPDW